MLILLSGRVGIFLIGKMFTTKKQRITYTCGQKNVKKTITNVCKFMKFLLCRKDILHIGIKLVIIIYGLFTKHPLLFYTIYTIMGGTC